MRIDVSLAVTLVRSACADWKDSPKHGGSLDASAIEKVAGKPFRIDACINNPLVHTVIWPDVHKANGESARGNRLPKPYPQSLVAIITISQQGRHPLATFPSPSPFRARADRRVRNFGVGPWPASEQAHEHAQ